MSDKGRNFGLDLVRTIAIALVIIAHFAKTQEYFGFFGVELFFGLSGYLIGQILWRSFSATEDWSFKRIYNFWSRRWWRTLPNYYLFFFVSLVYSFYMTGGIPSLSELSYFLWFGQDLFSRNHGFYGVSWSLCIEEWFYLLFPLVLFAVSRLKLRQPVVFALTLLCFFIIFPVARIILAEYGQAGALRTITFARLDAIAYGVFISFLQVFFQPGFLTKAVFFILGFLLFLSPIFMSALSGGTMENLRQDQLLLTIVPIGSSFMLPFVALMKSLTYRLRFIHIAVEKISLWSYSIYLCHLPILFFVYYLMSPVRDTTTGNLISKIVGLIITIAISAFIYTYFEVPLTKKRPKEIR